MKGVEVNWDADQKIIILSLMPMEVKQEVTISRIKTLVRKLNNDVYLVKDNIKTLLQALEKAKKKKSPDPVCADVAHRLDAQIVVTLSADNMTASMEITGPYGGEPVTKESVKACLSENRISSGISKERLLSLIKETQTLRAGEKRSAIIAKGKLARDGGDVKINVLFDWIDSKNRQPVSRGEGNVDMRNFGKIPYVESGDVLVHYNPATEGIPGKTVIGETVTPSNSQQIENKIQCGDGVEMVEGQNMFIAKHEGCPKLENGLLTVETHFRCKNCNVETGNIDFAGNVVVTGNVSSGMSIKAGGDVSITGFVEHSSINAGGKIHIAGRAFGKIDDNYTQSTTILQAEESIHIGSAHGVIIKTNRELSVDRELFYSSVTALEGAIVGTGEQPSGTIFASVLSVGKRVMAGKIGNSSNSSVIIDFTEVFKLLLQPESDLKQLIKEQQEFVTELGIKIGGSMVPSEEKSPSNQPVSKNKSLLQYEKEAEKLVQLNVELEDLMSKSQEAVESIRVNISKEIFPGVKIKYFDSVWETQLAKSTLILALQENKVVELV